jgi:hypothetical protein
VAASPAQIAEVLAGLRAGTARLVAASQQPAPARLPTGNAALDELLGGGLVRGRLSELYGPRSSGRMSATLGMLASAQALGELVAMVDVADAFDPRSAQAAGLELERMLWVRPRRFVDGLKAVDWVLDAGGFGLVVLYWCGVVLDRKQRVRGEAPWIKLARRAEKARAVFLLVGDAPLGGSLAAVTLVAQPARPRWSGKGSLAPVLLDGLSARITLVRSKLGPAAGAADLELRSDRPHRPHRPHRSGAK